MFDFLLNKFLKLNKNNELVGRIYNFNDIHFTNGIGLHEETEGFSF